MPEETDQDLAQTPVIEAATHLAELMGLEPTAVFAAFATLKPADPALAWIKRADAYQDAKEYRGPDTYQRFIAVLAATGSVPFAARNAGIHTGIINRRRTRYPEFDKAVVRALEHFASAVLEQAATCRAVDGVLEPVFYKGVIAGYVIKYSDTLMAKLLEGNLPEKYKQRTELSLSKGAVKILGGLPEPEDAAPQTWEHEPTKQISQCP